jgi:nicotinamidase-related amidase
MTHMCIDTTARAAFDLGFDCLIAGDACATRSLSYKGQMIRSQSVHLSFLASLDGIFGKVAGTEEIMALLGS